MTTIFDDEMFDFTCPNCKKKVSEKVRRLKQKGYTCPRCGVALDLKELGGVLAKMEQDWNKFQRDLAAMKITIKL